MAYRLSFDLPAAGMSDFFSLCHDLAPWIAGDVVTNPRGPGGGNPHVRLTIRDAATVSRIGAWYNASPDTSPEIASQALSEFWELNVTEIPTQAETE